jgi:Holliday junction DNA helicase RuvB
MVRGYCLQEMDDPYLKSSLTKEDVNFEVPLRPQSLVEFVGQEDICCRLDILIKAAQKRGEALGHCLFSGPPGLGKTTLANIVAAAMDRGIVITSGPLLEKPADLAGILTNLGPADVLFIDEIHRLNRVVEEYLYSAMEDFVLDVMIDSGPSARSVQVKLNPFTLIGATTRAGLLTAPMRSRFAMTCRLDYYQTPSLTQILGRSAKLLRMNISQEGLEEIALRSRGTPRIANNLLRWVRDFAQSQDIKLVDQKVANEALKMLAIDDKGLDEIDKKILELIIDHYGGGPVGINTLAVAVGEVSQTIEEVYEPFLILQGFLKRTPRGRMATALAYQHLKKKMNNESLF